MKGIHHIWFAPLAIILWAVALGLGLILILRDLLIPQRPKTNPHSRLTTHDSTTPDSPTPD